MTAKSGMRGEDRKVFDNLIFVQVKFLSPDARVKHTPHGGD
jgi:hypothetical protein